MVDCFGAVAGVGPCLGRAGVGGGDVRRQVYAPTLSETLAAVTQTARSRPRGCPPRYGACGLRARRRPARCARPTRRPWHGKSMMPVAWLDRCRSCFLVTAKPGGGRRIGNAGQGSALCWADLWSAGDAAVVYRVMVVCKDSRRRRRAAAALPPPGVEVLGPVASSTPAPTRTMCMCASTGTRRSGHRGLRGIRAGGSRVGPDGEHPASRDISHTLFWLSGRRIVDRGLTA